jgi:hypothetical protein
MAPPSRAWGPQVRLAFVAATLIGSAVALPARADADHRPAIELRITPPFARPYGPSLGARLAFPVTAHAWVGGGYELVQDYDVIVWTEKDVGHKPVAMSAIHAGAWYRGGAGRNVMSWAAGGLVAFSNPTISIASVPEQLDRAAYVVDVGADLSIGKLWDDFRFEVFATPAWSWGRIPSPAVGTSERLSRLTYRIGVALAILLGS